MTFEVTVSSDCWCSVLGSYLCTGYSDMSVPVDWLNLIKFEWMVDSVVSEVQRFQWLIVSVISEIDDWVLVISEIDWVSVIGW